MSDLIVQESSHYEDAHQLRILAALLDGETLANSRQMISEEIFFSEMAQRAASTLLNLYDSVGKLPDPETYFTEITREHHEKAPDVCRYVNRAWQLDKDEVRRKYVPELKKLIELVHTQKKAMECLNYCEEGDLVGAKFSIQQAQKTTCAMEESDYYDLSVEDRYKEDPAGRGRKFPTHWKELNKILPGGPAAGELHCIVGASGKGKSRLLLNLAHHFIAQGYYVAYVTLEMKGLQMMGRLDTIMTEMTLGNLRTPNGMILLQNKINEYRDLGGGIKFLKYLPYSVTIDQLGSGLRALPRKPDIVFCDYFELLNLKVPKSGNVWIQQSEMYAKFRGIMEELGACGWGVTQPTGKKEEQLDAYEDIGGSSDKVNHVDSFWSIYEENNSLKVDGSFGMLNLKNRVGPPGGMVHLKVDKDDTGMCVSENIAKG